MGSFGVIASHTYFAHHVRVPPCASCGGQPQGWDRLSLNLPPRPSVGHAPRVPAHTATGRSHVTLIRLRIDRSGRCGVTFTPIRLHELKSRVNQTAPRSDP